MTANAEPNTAAGSHGPGHISSLRQLVAVFVALLGLTVVTVAAAQVDLGDANVWIALGIAALKGSLVVLFFMHLRYDSPFNAVVFVAALVFVALFIGIALLDRESYQPQLIEGYAPAIQQAR
ncbi:MAG: caa(3)-type oxidase subunit IV [Acidobacteria bacterium]|nr:MAG: caa(3)-type oxidase subunit IV [Acidobacteriota bacterium]